MECFDGHVAAESKRNLTTKDTKNRENGAKGLSDIEGKAVREAVSEVGAEQISTILFRLFDLCDLGAQRSQQRVRYGEDTIASTFATANPSRGGRDSRAPRIRIVIENATI
jgi:hypothetical protein